MNSTSRKSRAVKKSQQAKEKKQARLGPNTIEPERGRTAKGGLLVKRQSAIAKRRQAEQALQSSEIGYRRLFEAAKDGILIIDAATGKITDVNPFLLELLGYSRAELMGRHLWELGFFRDIAHNKNEFRELQAKGYVRYEDLPLEKRNGQRSYVEFISNVYDVRGRQIIQCNIRDITARKQAEEKFEEERILLRTLIDSLPDRVYVMDQQGRTILANTADWQAAGAKTMEEVIGKTDLETYPPELGEQYWSVDQTVINSGTAVLNHEEQGTDPNGNPTWLLTSKVPLRDAKGKVRGLVGVGRDITERKRADARIERQVHRLSALRAIDTAISSSFDLRLSLNILLAQSINELGVDAAAVLVLNKFSNELEYAAGVGFRGGGITGLRLKLGEGLCRPGSPRTPHDQRVQSGRGRTTVFKAAPDA